MRHGNSLNLGPYQLQKQLGRGGYGKVYLAFDRILNRDFAVKVLQTPLLSEPSAVERFKREVELKGLTDLQHPNIVEVISLEDDPLPPYIVMEFVKGTHLGTYLKPAGMPLSEVLPILRQMATALDAAHAQGIIHGNLKPANILLNHQNDVKLTDFALVQILQSVNNSSQTHLGTVLYVAPEQVLGVKEITPATDIYALAVITYQMLVGQAPFVGSSHAVLAAHRDVAPPQPSSFGVNLPDQVVTALMQALSKEPSERHTTATDFIAALSVVEEQSYAAPTPIDVLPEPVPTSESAAPSTNLVVMPTQLPSEQATPDESRLLPPRQPKEVEVSEPVVKARPTVKKAASKAKEPTSIAKKSTTTPKAKGAAAVKSSSKDKAEEEQEEEAKFIGFPLAFVGLAVLLLLCLTGGGFWWFFGSGGAGEPAQVVVQTPSFSLREGPGDDYAIIGTYNQETSLTLVGREESGSWLQVETANGERGWLYSTLLQVNIPLSEVALVITATPTPTETLVPTETIMPTETPLPTETPQPTSEARPTRRPTRESQPRATRTPRSRTTEVISDTNVISDTGVLTDTIEIAEGVTLTDTDVLSETAALPPTATFIPTESAAEPTARPIIPTATYIPPTATYIPPTATYIPPTATYIPPTATYIPPTATYIPPTATYIPPTATYIPPTATYPPTATPWPTPIALPTWTAFPTAIPLSPTPALDYRISLNSSDYSRGCQGGFYIFGYILDSTGHPISGQFVQATSEYGYRIPPTTSKASPAGWYDIVISAERSRWFVQIVDGGGNSLSPTAEILNTGRFVDGSEACWHQVDFTKN